MYIYPSFVSCFTVGTVSIFLSVDLKDHKLLQIRIFLLISILKLIHVKLLTEIPMTMYHRFMNNLNNYNKHKTQKIVHEQSHPNDSTHNT